jgi:uncharacterized protein YndB with AHSA1/START domain
MTDAVATPTRSILVERELPHPPQKVWRALTQSPLIEDWMMENDFLPVVGHRFTFRSEPVGDWNGLAAGEVLVVEPEVRLAYSWNATGEGLVDGLKTIINWTLTPVDGGTHLRMEQSGFRSRDKANFQGASLGWQRFFAALEKVVADLE